MGFASAVEEERNEERERELAGDTGGGGSAGEAVEDEVEVKQWRCVKAKDGPLALRTPL